MIIGVYRKRDPIRLIVRLSETVRSLFVTLPSCVTQPSWLGRAFRRDSGRRYLDGIPTGVRRPGRLLNTSQVASLHGLAMNGASGGAAFLVSRLSMELLPAAE